MKRLLALSAVLIPLYLFAQGFGSFSHDQPYFAKDSSAVVGYATNLLYRWVSSDLPDSNVVFTSWTDRTNSRVLGVDTGHTMINTTNGVWFEDSDSSSLTNGSLANTIIDINTTNFSMGFIINVQEAGGTARILLSRSGGSDGSVKHLGTGPTFEWRRSSAEVTFFSAATNVWMDVLLVMTNNNMTTVFTNGVPSGFLSGVSLWRPISVGRWSGVPNTFGFRGFLREFWIRTNGLFSVTDLQNHATDIHYTRTNLYGP